MYVYIYKYIYTLIFYKQKPTHHKVGNKPHHAPRGFLSMDGYYVVGATTIPYLEFGYIMIIGSKEERNYLVSIAKNPQMHLP